MQISRFDRQTDRQTQQSHFPAIFVIVLYKQMMPLTFFFANFTARKDEKYFNPSRFEAHADLFRLLM